MNRPAHFEHAEDIGVAPLARRRQGRGLWRFLLSKRYLLAIVVLPTLLTAVYFYGFAANQYESEAHFIVKSNQQTLAANTGLGQLFGFGAVAESQSEAYSVIDYLTSHDATSEADRKIGLVDLFRRPEADLVSRLWWSHPKAENLDSYYQRMVHVTFNADTSVTTLTVHAFRPSDAQQLAETLLELGEARVNQMNVRAQEDTLRVSRNELASADQELSTIQAALTHFRNGQRDIDPEKTSSGQLLLVGQLRDQLAQSTAQLAAMSPYVNHDSPQFVALQSRIRGLQAQVSAESSKLAGGAGSLAPQVADYQGLLIRQDLAAKRYAAATAALAAAREQALKQQLFVVRVVEPNLPQKSLYPRRTIIVLSVLLCALLAYGIGWLIVAGVREHAT